MNNANRMLQNEVFALKGEVAQLKLQLLAHKECPVTLAMHHNKTTPHNSELSFLNIFKCFQFPLITIGLSKGNAQACSTVSNGAPTPSGQIIILNQVLAGDKQPVHQPLVVLPPQPAQPTSSPQQQDTSVIISLRHNK